MTLLRSGMQGNRRPVFLLARSIASVGGVGFLRPAPGTWGSLVGAITGFMLLGYPGWLAVGVIASALGGIWAIGRCGGTDDPGWVVIDEVAGQWLTLLGVSSAWTGYATGLLGTHAFGPLIEVAIAFVLFRLLDIKKPGPVGWADRHAGAVWVMLDDVIAGAIGAGIMLLLHVVLGL